MRVKRPFGAVGLLLMLASAGCVSQSASASQNLSLAGLTNTTLVGCVESWNHASLGDGRQRLAEASAGRGALMFVGSDGVCGVAIPAKLAQAAGEVPVFVSGLGGDYQLDADPLSGPASTISRFSSTLAARADRRTNVRVTSNGRVIALPEGSLAHSRATLLDVSSSCHVVVFAPWDSTWSITSGSTTCIQGRSIIWSWIAQHEDSRVHHLPPARRMWIAGWRCIGSDQASLVPGNGPAVYRRVSCQNGGDTIVAFQ